MSRSADPILETKRLDCGYPDRLVLTGVDFALREGEVVALLGPNGSGKSTLLKTVSRALPPKGGAVQLRGVPLTAMSAQQIARTIGYVPQQEAPAFDFTVAEIVMMGRIPHSDGLFETQEDVRASQEAMRRADCLDVADRPYSHLSGGEAQRVLIARALAQEPGILLLDEPTAHLDPRHQLAVAELVRDLAQGGYAVVAAVHDLNWASLVANRSLLLSGGVVTHDGPLEDALNSGALEQAYQVRFGTAMAGGSLRLFPMG